MTALLWLSVLVPLVGAVAVRASARRASAVAAVAGLLSAVGPVTLLVLAAGGRRGSTSVQWLPAADLRFGLQLDPLAALMSALVALTGAVVLIYSCGYFAGDPRRGSALAGLLAFLAAMQGLALADNYLPLLVFWELVGAASARLIAYSRDDPAAAPGAVRAFLTTRTADLGLYLALLALFAAHGSLEFGGSRPDGALGLLVGVGLVLAAMGKSAQAPLQSWLSGAMAGPTPASALLHSATMVAAGVYLLTRSADLLAGWPLQVAGWTGALTAVAAAAFALGQDDLKRVLAGSTSSHLGLMFVGLAAGGPAVAMFHLVAHAAGKSGLFLAAGVFQHQRGSTSLDELRGAGRDDPTTFALFAVCSLSIAAVPPLAVFWSKEHIAAAAELNAAWFVAVVLSAAGSAAYLLRVALVLRGTPTDAAGGRAAAATQPRRIMVAALAVPAAASVLLGVLGGPLRRLLDAPVLPTSALGLGLSLVAVLAGAGAVLAHLHIPQALRMAARRQLYVDDLLRIALQRPLLRLARLLQAGDRLLDQGVDGLARSVTRVSRLAASVDAAGIDAAVDGMARTVGAAGGRTQQLQSGRWFEYLRDAMLGAVVLGLLIVLTAVL